MRQRFRDAPRRHNAECFFRDLRFIGPLKPLPQLRLDLLGPRKRLRVRRFGALSTSGALEPLANDLVAAAAGIATAPPAALPPLLASSCFLTGHVLSRPGFDNSFDRWHTCLDDSTTHFTSIHFPSRFGHLTVDHTGCFGVRLQLDYGSAAHLNTPSGRSLSVGSPRLPYSPMP